MKLQEDNERLRSEIAKLYEYLSELELSVEALTAFVAYLLPYVLDQDDAFKDMTKYLDDKMVETGRRVGTPKPDVMKNQIKHALFSRMREQLGPMTSYDAVSNDGEGPQ